MRQAARKREASTPCLVSRRSSMLATRYCSGACAALERVGAPTCTADGGSGQRAAAAATRCGPRSARQRASWAHRGVGQATQLDPRVPDVVEPRGDLHGEHRGVRAGGGWPCHRRDTFLGRSAPAAWRYLVLGVQLRSTTCLQQCKRRHARCQGFDRSERGAVVLVDDLRQQLVAASARGKSGGVVGAPHGAHRCSSKTLCTAEAAAACRTCRQAAARGGTGGRTALDLEP